MMQLKSNRVTWLSRLTATGVLAVAAMGLTASPVSAETTDVLARIKESGVIRVANTHASPPWSQLNAQNQPEGYDIDVAHEIAKRLGVKVSFVVDTYKNFVSSVNSDRYDVVISILTPTEERKKQVDFSDAYLVSSLHAFVHTKNQDIKTQADMNGKRVGVSAGTTNEAWVRENIKNADIRTYNNALLAFSDLVNGRTDAAVYSYASGVKLARESNLPVRPVGEPLKQDPGAVAFKKDQPALKAAINKAIADMIADGTMTRISKKWLDGLDMSKSLTAYAAERK